MSGPVESHRAVLASPVLSSPVFSSPVLSSPVPAVPAVGAYGSFSSTPKPAPCGEDLVRREADLAQRERELAQREQEHRIKFRACCVPGGAMAGLSACDTLGALVGPSFWQTSPGMWRPLVRRLWQCWAVGNALLACGWLVLLVAWSMQLARGSSVLLASLFMLVSPPATWVGWLLPVSNFAHLHPSGVSDGPVGGWVVVASFAVYVVFAGIAALGPPGWGLPGGLVAVSWLERTGGRQSSLLGVAALLIALGWAGLCALGLTLYRLLVRPAGIGSLSALPIGAISAAGPASDGSRLFSKRPVAYGRI